ncbi:Short-chain dehydrogenase reductase SDR protein [Rutstroemia sp. NJR-2017a BVV2]|nr:Short-chain dehydrogenase reductase SDR protein [Rutstroemia sp. NJR-2017a BVV2]
MFMNITGFALVTGAGSGIGRDTAIAFAIEGAAGVLFADIDENTATEAANESRNLAQNPSYQAYSIRVDVSDEASVVSMVNFAVEKFGKIDYCVNSAGVGVEHPLEIAEASVAEFERFWNVNVKGTLLCLKAESAAMKKQDIVTVPTRSGPRNIGRGTIINLGSCNSYMATPKIVQYTSAKHAVLGMTKNAALDNAPYGIRVNAICPSWVDTPMVARAVEGDPSLGELMKRTIPMGRIAQQQEVSDIIMFLSSPRSSYVTGAGWIVDGGTTLQLQR